MCRVDPIPLTFIGGEMTVRGGGGGRGAQSISK